MHTNLELTRTEHFTNGLSRDWYADDQIMVYSVRCGTMENVNAWGELVTQTSRDWPADKLFLGLHDLSQLTHIPLSPRSYSWVLQMARDSSHVTGRVGVILPPSGLATVVETLLRINITPLMPRMRLRVFFGLEEGLAWLSEQSEVLSRNKKPPAHINGGS